MASTLFVVNSIFSIGFLLAAILLTVLHLYAVVKNIKGSLFAAKTYQKHPSLPFTYVLMVINILSGISLTSDSVFTAALCPYAQFYGPTLYSLFKTVVYLILCVRIHISFKNSVYEYNRRNLAAWSVLLIVWTLFSIIAGNLTVKSRVDQDTKCIVETSVVYIVSQLLLDFVSMITNCILFVRPVCKLYRVSDGHLSLKTIAIKQCILSSIAVISSFITLIGIGTATDLTPSFVSIDMCLSTCCMVLMYKWNSGVVEKLCGCCLPKRTEDSIIMDAVGNQQLASATSGNSLALPRHGSMASEAKDKAAGHMNSASTTMTNTAVSIEVSQTTTVTATGQADSHSN